MVVHDLFWCQHTRRVANLHWVLLTLTDIFLQISRRFLCIFWFVDDFRTSCWTFSFVGFVNNFSRSSDKPLSEFRVRVKKLFCDLNYNFICSSLFFIENNKKINVATVWVGTMIERNYENWWSLYPVPILLLNSLYMPPSSQLWSDPALVLYCLTM